MLNTRIISKSRSSRRASIITDEGNILTMSLIEDGGTLSLEVKFSEIDGDQRWRKRPSTWVLTLKNVKHGERTVLDTLVVHLAVNAGCSMSDNAFGILANALNTPPEYYNRKV